MNSLANMLKKFLLIMMISGCLLSLSACAGDDSKAWQEEVKLNDSRVIVASIKFRFEGAYNGSNYGGVLRESWITLKLPETGNQATTWNKKLQPKNLNVVNGKLYIVGMPPTDREFYLYNKPRPPYIGYVFENKAWRRIPFNEIPEAMYDMNLSSGAIHPNSSGLVTLADKAVELGDPRILKAFRRIAPSHRDTSDNGSNPKIY